MLMFGVGARLIFGFVEPRLETPIAPMAPLGTSLVISLPV